MLKKDGNGRTEARLQKFRADIQGGFFFFLKKRKIPIDDI